MGEKMTLEQVRDRCVAWVADVAANGSLSGAAASDISRMFDNLTQPAQAVDVGAMLDFAVSRAEKFVGSQGVVFALRFEPMANQGNLRDYLTAALPKNVQEKPVAYCPKCAANQPHHTDPNSSGCLHLCDVCNSVVEY